nr:MULTISPECIES: hypothetical protein [Rhizobium/Agrobacterium group]
MWNSDGTELSILGRALLFDRGCYQAHALMKDTEDVDPTGIDPVKDHMRALGKTEKAFPDVVMLLSRIGKFSEKLEPDEQGS